MIAAIGAVGGILAFLALVIFVPRLIERRRERRLEREADAILAKVAADEKAAREARDNRAAAIAAAFRLPELLYYRDPLPAAPVAAVIVGCKGPGVSP